MDHLDPDKIISNLEQKLNALYAILALISGFAVLAAALYQKTKNQVKYILNLFEEAPKEVKLFISEADDKNVAEGKAKPLALDQAIEDATGKRTKKLKAAEFRDMLSRRGAGPSATAGLFLLLAFCGGCCNHEILLDAAAKYAALNKAEEEDESLSPETREWAGVNRAAWADVPKLLGEGPKGNEK